MPDLSLKLLIWEMSYRRETGGLPSCRDPSERACSCWNWICLIRRRYFLSALSYQLPRCCPSCTGSPASPFLQLATPELRFACFKVSAEAISLSLTSRA